MNKIQWKVIHIINAILMGVSIVLMKYESVIFFIPFCLNFIGATELLKD